MWLGSVAGTHSMAPVRRKGPRTAWMVKTTRTGTCAKANRAVGIMLERPQDLFAGMETPRIHASRRCLTSQSQDREFSFLRFRHLPETTGDRGPLVPAGVGPGPPGCRLPCSWSRTLPNPQEFATLARGRVCIGSPRIGVTISALVSSGMKKLSLATTRLALPIPCPGTAFWHLQTYALHFSDPRGALSL